MAGSYTIGEAAKLLGVPQRRVWQLLERGLLSGGVDDRHRWRIYLGSPDPATATPQVSTTQPSAGVATAEPPEGASHFRELLAELRHLQERYGQALLALGEARGETAALRARLELLEGGRELVLAPAPAAAAPRARRADAAGARRRVRSASQGGPGAAPTAAVAPGERRAEPEPQARRFGRAGVAEALARADDPSPPQLPGGREAAEALAALRASHAAGETVPIAVDKFAASRPRPASSPVPAPPAAAADTASSSPPRGLAGRLRRWIRG